MPTPPLSLGGVIIPLDYSTRDYEGYRTDALNLAPTLTPEWTDFYPTDPGVVLTEMFAYIGDNLSYYIDRAANETYLPTATQRRSVINLGRLMGYELLPATSAIVTVSFTTTLPGIIAAGDQVSTDPAPGSGELSIVYEVITSTAVGVGTTDIDCIEGTSITGEILGSGNALPSQSFTLANSPLSIDPSGVSSLQVYVDEGIGPVLYQQVANFLESEPTSRHYITRVDENDIVTITFGNGVNGVVVAGGVNNVTADYRVGGGAIGNQVGAGSIVKYLGSNLIIDSVTNAAAPQGGSDKETLDEARSNIPDSLRSLNRAVTLEDYELLARTGVGGVAQAKAVRGLGPYETVVYVAAAGSNPIATGTWDSVSETGTGLIGQVGNYLVPLKAAPIRLKVRPPTGVPLEMVGDLAANEGFFQTDVETEVKNTLVGVVESLYMGENVMMSDIMYAVESLPSVKWFRLRAFRRQPTVQLLYPDPIEYVSVPDTTWAITPIESNSTFSDFVLGSGGVPSLPEVFTVKFISATSYTVTGSITGGQSTTGQIGVEWTSDLGDVSWLATAGGILNYPGNQYRITLGSGFLDSEIFIGEYEIATLGESDITITQVVGGIK